MYVNYLFKNKSEIDVHCLFCQHYHSYPPLLHGCRGFCSNITKCPKCSHRHRDKCSYTIESKNKTITIYEPYMESYTDYEEVPISYREEITKVEKMILYEEKVIEDAPMRQYVVNNI